MYQKHYDCSETKIQQNDKFLHSHTNEVVSVEHSILEYKLSPEGTPQYIILLGNIMATIWRVMRHQAEEQVSSLQ